MSEITGIIFNIERFTLHDGPGIRTTVYLKGCPLTCAWCCNPESQHPLPELIYFAEKCTGCKRCLELCVNNSISQLKDQQSVQVNFLSCKDCGECIPVCYSNALIMTGEKKSSSVVVDLVTRDKPFYDHSGGGVTLSGGEPLAQPEFSAEILRLCKARNIRTAMQTCGFCAPESIDLVMPYLDLVIFDLKHMDKAKHREFTGQSNVEIIENLRYINSQKKNLVLQVPLVPGCNDSDENLNAIFSLAKELKSVQGVSLLAYHTLGAIKYSRLGKSYSLSKTLAPSHQYLQDKIAQVNHFGMPIIKFNG